MKTIEIFTGNRAEFGILSSLIEELSCFYNINLLISGSHVLNKWQTKDEIIAKIKEFKHVDRINTIELAINIPETKYNYANLLPSISNEYLKYKNSKDNPVEFCLFLGDRIETAAYAMSAMYLEEVLIHICGGDVGDIAHFDHNIRHAITKMSHIHLVTNDQSKHVVRQLGEENWRICNIGMPSLDITTKKTTFSKEELLHKFNLNSDKLIITTYHPDHYADEKESLNNFKSMIKGIASSNYNAILTYPNNDPGYEEIIYEIENHVCHIGNIQIIKNLGINNYISLLNNMKVLLIGNTSSIVLESPFFKTPSLLLGRRQSGRYKGLNVTELIEFTSDNVSSYINDTFANYNEIQENFIETQYIYGDGESSQKTASFINNIFKNHTKFEILSKKFILNTED